MNGEDFKRLEQIVFNFKEEVKAEFRYQIGIQSEHFQHKLDIVVEGHQMLSEKIDRVEERQDKRMDCLEHKLDNVAAELGEVKVKGNYTAAKLDTVALKLDTVAADLTAHRKDTEAHPTIYKVKEGI
jgi:seryl-tRNA synthetase